MKKQIALKDLTIFKEPKNIVFRPAKNILNSKDIDKIYNETLVENAKESIAKYLNELTFLDSEKVRIEIGYRTESHLDKYKLDYKKICIDLNKSGYNSEMHTAVYQGYEGLYVYLLISRML